MGVEGEGNPKKRRLNLNFDNLLPSDDEEEDEPEIVIENSINTEEEEEETMESFEGMSDHDIEEKIKKHQHNIIKLGPNLIDKGEKLRRLLKKLEEERQRRQLTRLAVVVDDDDSQSPWQAAVTSGTADAFRQQPISTANKFTALLIDKIDGNTNCKVDNAFDKEVSMLNTRGRDMGRQNGSSSSRDHQFQFPSGHFRNGDKNVLSNGNHRGTSSSKHFQVQTRNHALRKRKQPVVLVVEDDEPELLDTKDEAEKLNIITECIKKKEVKIYYPSRNDPKSVEISNEDMKCLAPEAYLTSHVMNFYIRYIQQATPMNRAGCNYHIFSTYFYKKLQEAVAYKGIDKDAVFNKFRRWWKGINIFEKAYVLIPIHDDLHWSLVIICIPDKEEEVGPIILHLDSLGFHCSKSIFNDVRSYMKIECAYLNKAGVSLEKRFPNKIEEKRIPVPQQKNDYDCGLFVLYFMERFIEEAPERLKKKDLAMFGKQWFKPEEASSLRVKIREILMKEFENACNSDSSSSSPKSVENCD
ncbi:hypothetical protein ACFE04_025363 [Oxalis oulophora]